jgi:23S rRNA pseudouridine1911/1915/1917 synthase
MNNAIRTFIADEADAGVRADKFLASKMPEFSRSEIVKFRIVKLVGARQETGSKAKLSEKIKAGDEFVVEIPESDCASCLVPFVSEKFALEILHEDPDIIVVNKPRGIAMYPGAGRTSGTLVQAILAHTNLSLLGGNLRPGVVHRLDKDTSGAVIFAKSDAAHRALVQAFSAHDLTRKYIAFVWGIPNWEEADIEGNIGRSTRNRQKMTMLNMGGKFAKTHAAVVGAWSDCGISKIRCTLSTGRTHQIRVHLSSHGFPVVCDPLYGRGNARLGSVKNSALLDFLKTTSGQMLHAEILELAHPVTGAPLKFKAKMPADMQELQSIIQAT